jgi:prevent-host-death family protein
MLIYSVTLKGALVEKIPVTRFRSRCLAVIDQVSNTRRPVVVTKYGKPIMKLVPAGPAGEDIFGFMAGKAKIVGDIETSAPLSDWNLP